MAAILAALTGACTAESQSCGNGYCLPPLVCASSTLGCCADPDWLATLDGGAEDLLAALETAAADGGADGGLPPFTCGPIAR